MTRSNKARNPRSPLKDVKKRFDALKTCTSRTVKNVAVEANRVVRDFLRKRYLGSFPKRRDAVQDSVEYRDRVAGLLKMAKEIVNLALMDKDVKNLVLSLLTETKKEAFLLTPSGIINSRRLLKKVRELIGIAPSGRILDAVLQKMQLCIKQGKEFPLQCKWAPNLKMRIAYEDDLHDLYARTRKMREADMVEKMYIAGCQVAIEFGIVPDIARLIDSFIQT